MTFWEITGAAGFLIWFFAFLGALVLCAAAGLNKAAYWVEKHYPTTHTEHDASPVVERCQVYTLRPRNTTETPDMVRPRRGDAA